VDVIEPEVYLIARPQIDWRAIEEYLQAIGSNGDWYRARAWGDESPAQDLVEFEGRLCYRSFEPGLNPNVTRIREGQDIYLENLLASSHGSVLEHATFSFVFHNVSRVVTHELVRHRVGTAISQESLRYVRLKEIPFWFPAWARDDEELMGQCEELLLTLEAHQVWMAEHFGLNEEGISFAEKKAKTSFMRRFAPGGLATEIGWTANIRTIRNVIEQRTDHGAEEEIRLVFGKVARLMQKEIPVLMADYSEQDDGCWMPQWRKV